MRAFFVLVAAVGVACLCPANAQAILLYASSGNDLARFDSGATGVVSSVQVTGLQSGETIIGLDSRPATGEVYALGSTGRLYTVNPLTGTTTLAGGPLALNGSQFGADFNPVTDILRVMGNTGQNVRLNPNGSLNATDTAVTPAGTIVTALAYSNNTPGAASTTLYGIDAASGQLGTFASPNNGVFANLGSLGVGTNLDLRLGFDISGAGNSAAFATILTGGTDKLYSINLSTGAATLVGTIGGGITIYSSVTAPLPVPEPASAVLLIVAPLAIVRRRRR